MATRQAWILNFNKENDLRPDTIWKRQDTFLQLPLSLYTCAQTAPYLQCVPRDVWCVRRFALAGLNLPRLASVYLALLLMTFTDSADPSLKRAQPAVAFKVHIVTNKKQPECQLPRCEDSSQTGCTGGSRITKDEPFDALSTASAGRRETDCVRVLWLSRRRNCGHAAVSECTRTPTFRDTVVGQNVSEDTGHAVSWDSTISQEEVKKHNLAVTMARPRVLLGVHRWQLEQHSDTGSDLK
jgi:hypothetical protein